MKFTGERFILGQAVGDITIEHMQRYKIALNLVEGKNVLDAACGEGYGSYILSKKAKTVIGIDISSEAIEYASEEYKNKNLKYICASIEKLPLEDNSIDIIISFETIEHVNENIQKKFLSEIKRVLRPNGILFMSSPDKYIYSDVRNSNNPYHVHELYINEFKDLLQLNFKYVELFSQGIGNQRIGLIEKINKNKINRINMLNNFLLKDHDKQYVLALCSNLPISSHMDNLIESVMPFEPKEIVRMFVDIGLGFNETDVIVGNVEKNGNTFKVNFTFNDWKNIKYLRFDPIEKKGCICKINLLKSNLKNISVKAYNADKTVLSVDYFFNTDPQYQIIGDFNDLEYISIEYTLELISLNELIKILSDKNIENNIEIENKNKEIENKNKEIENKNKEIENIKESRGYKVLKKYYGFRDRILPINSRRRKLVKHVINSKKNFKIVKAVINLENLKKGCVFLKRYGIKEFCIKLNNKINQIESKENLLESKKEYLNYLLEKDNYIIDKNIIVDIIIPIYNAYEYTKKCIESIYKNTDIKYNLYLINDCSPDKRIKELLNNVLEQEKPINMEGLYIIENEKNLGFIKTVNKAINLSKNHIVLLNTDTEVPKNWLSRLILPILKDKKIASVTPFANSATICSFPNFCKDNNLPEGISLQDLDTIFYNCGGYRIIEIPTGVGFCMAMNRECISKIGELDTIYGKGYGEENDWCRRAVKYGYKNVMITNLFIYHKHGVSFAEQIDKSKQDRINENLKILTKRYPDYIRLVDEFIIKDPVKNIRDFLYYIYLENKNSIKENGVLFINHSCGGGTKVYQDNLIAKWRCYKRIYLIELLSDLKTICFTIYRDEQNRSFYFNLKDMDEKQFCNLIKAFNINYIYINQLVTYPLEKMINFIIATKIKYTFFVHDFYSVCPEYTLLNQNRVYCNAEKNIEKCNLCLKKQNNIICKDIKYWRIMFENFLSKATEVIVPSESTAKIIKSYYQKLDIIIEEHDIPNYIHKTFEPEFLKKDILNVAVIGAISENKGSNIVYDLVENIRKEKLPINVKIIGITNLQSNYYKSEDGILEITGRYNNNEISDLLAKYQIGIVLIPSIWPETYSYTASEAIYSGYPIVVFDIGAPADRVRSLNCGWILKSLDGKELLDKIRFLANNKDEINKKLLLNKE